MQDENLNFKKNIKNNLDDENSKIDSQSFERDNISNNTVQDNSFRHFPKFKNSSSQSNNNQSNPRFQVQDPRQFQQSQQPQQSQQSFQSQSTQSNNLQSSPRPQVQDPRQFQQSQQPQQSQQSFQSQSTQLNNNQNIYDESQSYKPKRKMIEQYPIKMENQLISVEIFRDAEGFSHYDISIVNITKSTRIILDKIREEFISKINIGMIDLSDESSSSSIKELFREEILVLIKKYFPKTDKETSDLLVNELMRQNIGLGDIEILLRDENLEEIVVNSAKEPVQVYHKKYGWLLTNILLPTEKRIRHYSTVIGSEVGKEITLLKPLMDARLLTGDRVNATLSPISSRGNTITIRKFATRPWTITDFLKDNTISYSGAALIWLAVENEFSVIISGGTGSGKTSMLNVVSSFIPTNQRIISIEDTRELQLPKELHWVPLETRIPNPEGKGGVTMLDLVVNSLRMRPDRIIMGEVRRKQEAEVLFEAMHTGHSVYGTFHANNVRETIDRFTNPPIDVPKMLLSALGLIVVQSRNRRTGKRNTLQIAEMLPNGDSNLLMQFDINKNSLVPVNESKTMIETLKLFTGMNQKQIEEDLNEKINVLKNLVKNDITDINKVGTIFREYYNVKRDKQNK